MGQRKLRITQNDDIVFDWEEIRILQIKLARLKTGLLSLLEFEWWVF